MSLQATQHWPHRDSAAPHGARRRMAWALAASAILHGLLLWPSPRPAPVLTLAQPLAVMLRAPAQPAVIAAAPGAGRPSLAVLPRRARPLPPVRAAAHVPPPVLTVQGPQKLPSPAVAEPDSTRPAIEPMAQGTLGEPAAPEAAQAPTGAANTAAASALLQDGVDGNALREFRMAVARRIGPRDFPDLAQEIGSGNTSVVRVVVGPEAGAAAITVASSSGHARLDARARDLIGAGVRSTTVPAALRGRAFATDFRVEFRPREDNALQ